MIDISEKINCRGCSDCRNICPACCIAMVKDGEGFSYPSVDMEK